MKKRAMKKYIPKNTPYCHHEVNGKFEYCKWLKYIKTIKLDKTNCESSDACDKECWSDSFTSCRIRVWRCEYMGYTDWEEESLLFDACKECCVSEGR